ncbi:hypothetical protein BpHYR1_009001 [Brachionus plicatilis]|uniref:Uncharacterized protein n=1 Tax=Brachionus plicatilis TaxID=10195 RepID=A0A3M7QD56_BRAPC|nr:hypothetical protein BpHYR1_009001 [Brachionus plicatilis]
MVMLLYVSVIHSYYVAQLPFLHNLLTNIKLTNLSLEQSSFKKKNQANIMCCFQSNILTKQTTEILMNLDQLNRFFAKRLFCWDPYKRILNRPKFSEIVTVSALEGQLYRGHLAGSLTVKILNHQADWPTDRKKPSVKWTGLI